MLTRVTFSTQSLVGVLNTAKLSVMNITELGDLILENDFIVTINSENMHKYSLQDVVLPLPGGKIQYPSNFTQDFYTEILAQDGLDFASFENLPK